MEFHDFDLAFHATVATNGPADAGAKAYMVVARSTQGESATVMHPKHIQELGALEKQIHSNEVTISMPALRPISEELGSKLFDAAFQGEVRDLFFLSYGRALGEQRPLRIRLRFSGAVPELAALSWEYLYWKERGRFLALSTETSIVRYLEMPDLSRSLKGELPLNMLMVLASPKDKANLRVNHHKNAVEQSLSELERHKKLNRVVLQEASSEKLVKALGDCEFDVVHIVAHGTFDGEAKEGSLVFEQLLRKSAPVSDRSLATLLEHHAPRLVLIAACRGAEASSGAVFDGVAQRLVQQGIPTVIAMRSPVAIEDAERLAGVFWEETAQGNSIDTALTKARVRLQLSHPTSWGIPALFSRSRDTYLFDLPRFFGHPFEQQLLSLEAADSDPKAGLAVVRETPLRGKRLGDAGDELLRIQEDFQSDHREGRIPDLYEAFRKIQRFFELLKTAPKLSER